MIALETMAMFNKYLRSLERWIERARAHAAERKFDPEVLLGARLAPDQFALVRQVHAACDSARLSAARLAGVEPPAHPNTDKTIDEMVARLHACLAYLETLGPEQFEGSDDRPCRHQWMQGKYLRGADYVREYAIPNFLFHVTTAYAILRHNGVPLGKVDFLAPMTLLD